MKIKIIFFLAWICFFSGFSQVSVVIDLSAATHPVSPYLYGRNNSLSDNSSSSLSTAAWKKLQDAGVTFFRESGGNNCTKYNWRRKLSSHPDWYNNVYSHDWDFAAKSLQQNITSAQGMWSFQLIGKAASTTASNFNDWGYNQSNWWEGVRQNLAGGGVPKISGGEDALQEGNPSLYLEDWPADSTVKIIDHWFGPGGIGLDKDRIQYWNMDNETEIWSGTHDDIMPSQLSAEAFMQKYFEVAKKARAKYPDIKLVGPVTANEWQWYNWVNSPVSSGGSKYAWLQYFIKRVAEEQVASGVRLLDVLDIHFYPGSTTVSDVVQYHRVFFDKTYVFPEANGVKNVSGTWDNSQSKEYIFQRCREWLEQYMGSDHGVTFSVTEIGIPDIGANGIAVWYASTLGEFMRHPDMEIFSPWHWYPAMWEVLHLFSRHNKSDYVASISSDEELVSAYSTLSEGEDSLTVVLVNRATSGTKSVEVSFNGFSLASQEFEVLKLNSLPSTETFVSHQVNALKKSVIQKNENELTLSLPALSVTTLLLKGTRNEVVTDVRGEATRDPLLEVFPNPVIDRSAVKLKINKPGLVRLEVTDENGKVLRKIYKGSIETIPFIKEIDLPPSRALYFIRLNHNGNTVIKKIIR